MMDIKRFSLYLLRWQLSTPILYICIRWIPLSNLLKTIISNLIGAFIFYWVDRRIFKDKKTF